MSWAWSSVYGYGELRPPQTVHGVHTLQFQIRTIPLLSQDSALHHYAHTRITLRSIACDIPVLSRLTRSHEKKIRQSG